MSNIRVIEKDNSIGYDKIKEIIIDAHKINKGFKINTSDYTEQEIIGRIGSDGKCFVALDGEKVIGTASIRLIEINSWYYKGLIPEYTLVGVIREYQGKHVNTLLANKVFEYLKTNNYKAIELKTAENNKHAIKVYKHQGFKLVDYFDFKTVDHFSVGMIKYFENNNNKPDIYRLIRYNLKRIYIKIKHKIKNGGKQNNEVKFKN